MSKADTLMYYVGMTPETIEQMKEVRRRYVDLARYVESLGNSAELTIAFRNIEQAQMYTIKHLCMADLEASLTDE